MRSRRLGLKRKSPRYSEGSEKPPEKLSQIEEAIWQREMPGGPCPDSHCTDCHDAVERIVEMISCAHQAFATTSQLRGIPDDVREKIFNDAYSEAMDQLAEKHRHQLEMAQQQGYTRGQNSLQSMVVQERNDAYQRGFQAGALTAPAAPAMDNSKVHNEMVEMMLDQCKIIVESNPNMKPGVNAVRHRIKKLRSS